MSAARPAPPRFHTRTALLACAGCLAAASLSAGSILIVDPVLGPYMTIQSALDACSAGDTVEVVAGTYTESVQVPVSVTLRSRSGQTSTFLDGEGAHRLLESHGHDLTIEGFTFQNGRTESEEGGGAVVFSQGSLTVLDCAFRSNKAVLGHSGGAVYGGAIRAFGEVFHGLVRNCLFADNEAAGWASSWGGGFAYREYVSGAPNESARLFPAQPACELVIEQSTFIGNWAGYYRHVCQGTDNFQMNRCLLIDGPRESISPVDPTGLQCCILWPGVSPQVLGTWYKTGGSEWTERSPESLIDGVAFVDPRVCPGNDETIHESSPANSDPICGPIGTLPVGCEEPTILAARPLHLVPLPEQYLRVYGYGLDGATGAALVGPSGQRIEATGFSQADVFISALFDLSGQEEGSWSIAIATPSGEATMDGVDVSAVQIRGFLNGWVASPSLYEGTLFGEAIPAGVSLDLRHTDTGATVPVEILQQIGTDSLRVRADLGGSAAGPYDLAVQLPGGGSFSVPFALYLGAPPQMNVPGDHATIGEALAAAPDCAEIVVGPGTYSESLTIDRPVRLRSAVGATIQAPSGGHRVIHVLAGAGPLTEVKDFVVQGGSVAQAPGGGILCEAPARIEGCVIYNNHVEGVGGVGGGIHAGPGARIVGNSIYGNVAEADQGAPDIDPWTDDPAAAGLAGGLYCRSSLVLGNHIEGNYAGVCGGFVADGILRGNRIIRDGASALTEGAARGEIMRNEFLNECEGYSYLLMEGPSRIGYNTFGFIYGDLCNETEEVYLRGSVDFFKNSLYGASIYACLSTSDAEERPPGRFRMRDNIIDGNAFVRILRGVDWDPCLTNGDGSPRTLIPDDSIRVECNMIRALSAFRYFGQSCGSCAFEGAAMYCEIPDYPDMGWDLRIDSRSPALPGNRDTPGCADTLGALGIGCGPSPIVLDAYGLEAVEEGVRLHWSVGADLAVDGFEIERAVRDGNGDGSLATITAAPIIGCRSCEFVDRDLPPGSMSATYRLIVLLPGGTRETLVLGIWNGERVLPMRPVVRAAPNPVFRGSATVTVGLPAAGRARLDLIDLDGKRLATLHDGPLPAGFTRIPWNGRRSDGEGRIGSGVYILKLETPSGSDSRKILVMN